jgi:hypothetical protein
MVDTPLMIIFLIREEACWLLFGLQRWPILSVCIKMAKSLINYLTYKTKNCRYSVDAQFRNLAGSVSISLLPIKEAFSSLMNLCDESPCRVTMMLSQTMLNLR